MGIIVLALPEEKSAKGLVENKEGNTLKCKAVYQPTGLVPLGGLLGIVALSIGLDNTWASFLYNLKLSTRVQVYWCDNFRYYYIKVMCSGSSNRLPYPEFSSVVNSVSVDFRLHIPGSCNWVFQLSSNPLF